MTTGTERAAAGGGAARSTAGGGGAGTRRPARPPHFDARLAVRHVGRFAVNYLLLVSWGFSLPKRKSAAAA